MSMDPDKDMLALASRGRGKRSFPDLGERVMRMSSSLVAPSAAAILSTALLCGLSGTAASQTTPSSTLPSVTVTAPEQRARPPQRQERAANTGAGLRRGPATRTTAQTAGGTPSAARGPVMAKLARLEREASSCNDGCESSFPRGKDPWVGCSEFGGILFSFLGNLQRHTHSQGLRAMRGNQNVPGLGPKPILVVLHRHAERGEISGHRRESKQIAHAYRGSTADS